MAVLINLLPCTFSTIYKLLKSFALQVQARARLVMLLVDMMHDKLFGSLQTR